MPDVLINVERKKKVRIKNKVEGNAGANLNNMRT